MGRLSEQIFQSFHRSKDRPMLIFNAVWTNPLSIDSASIDHSGCGKRGMFPYRYRLRSLTWFITREQMFNWVVICLSLQQLCCVVGFLLSAKFLVAAFTETKSWVVV